LHGFPVPLADHPEISPTARHDRISIPPISPTLLDAPRPPPPLGVRASGLLTAQQFPPKN